MINVCRLGGSYFLVDLGNGNYSVMRAYNDFVMMDTAEAMCIILNAGDGSSLYDDIHACPMKYSYAVGAVVYSQVAGDVENGLPKGDLIKSVREQLSGYDFRNSFKVVGYHDGWVCLEPFMYSGNTGVINFYGNMCTEQMVVIGSVLFEPFFVIHESNVLLKEFGVDSNSYKENFGFNWIGVKEDISDIIVDTDFSFVYTLTYDAFLRDKLMVSSRVYKYCKENGFMQAWQTGFDISSICTNTEFIDNRGDARFMADFDNKLRDLAIRKSMYGLRADLDELGLWHREGADMLVYTGHSFDWVRGKSDMMLVRELDNPFCVRVLLQYMESASVGRVAFRVRGSEDFVRYYFDYVLCLERDEAHKVVGDGRDAFINRFKSWISKEMMLSTGFAKELFFDYDIEQDYRCGNPVMQWVMTEPWMNDVAVVANDRPFSVVFKPFHKFESVSSSPDNEEIRDFVMSLEDDWKRVSLFYFLDSAGDCFSNIDAVGWLEWNVSYIINELDTEVKVTVKDWEKRFEL